jgi:hypothetical protein
VVLEADLALTYVSEMQHRIKMVFGFVVCFGQRKRLCVEDKAGSHVTARVLHGTVLFDVIGIELSFVRLRTDTCGTVVDGEKGLTRVQSSVDTHP